MVLVPDLCVTPQTFTSLDHCPKGLAYLATPHDVTDDKDKAAGDAATWHGLLLAEGVVSIPPFVLWHSMAGAPEAVAWSDYAGRILERCDCVVAPPIRGRAQSVSVAREVQMARARNMPVVWL